MDFAMTWYSYIFPNTALTTATFAVAKALNDNKAINVLGCVLTVGLIILWFIVFGMMIRAVWIGQILWPQKQEDRDEGGFQGSEIPGYQRRRSFVSRAGGGDLERTGTREAQIARTATVPAERFPGLSGLPQSPGAPGPPMDWDSGQNQFQAREAFRRQISRGRGRGGTEYAVE